MVFLLSLTYSWRTKVREITPYIKQTICWWSSIAIQYPLLTSVTLFTIRVCKVMWLVGGPLVLRFFRIQSSWIYAWTHADEMWSEVAWVSPRKNHWIAMYKSMFSLPAPGDCSHCWCGIPTIGKDLQCWTPTKGLSLRPMQELANTNTKLLSFADFGPSLSWWSIPKELTSKIHCALCYRRKSIWKQKTRVGAGHVQRLKDKYGKLHVV